MCKVGKIILKVFAILAAIAGVVAAVYYWNLDQKLLDWFYKKTEWFKSLRVPSRFMRKIVCRLRLSEVSRQ